MSQVTQGLIDEFRLCNNVGQPAPYTRNEFEQLLYAWEELQRARAKEPKHFERPARGWFRPGIEMTWRTRCGRQRNITTGYGWEWFCRNCSYSPGPSDIPHPKCNSCGASLIASEIFDGGTKVVVRTTDYGFELVSVKFPIPEE